MFNALLLGRVMTPDIAPPLQVSVPISTFVPPSVPLTNCRLGAVNTPLIVVLPPRSQRQLLLIGALLANVMLFRSSNPPLAVVKVPLPLFVPPPLMVSVPLWTVTAPVLDRQSV